MLRVRSRVIGGWLLASGVLATVLFGACADKKGALMLAINTDMRAPKDVNAVSVTISTNGAIKHSFIGRVTPQGEVLLPATLAIVQPDDPNATIRVRVMAFQERKPRVLRDVRTTVPTDGRTALLRIPLNFVNDQSAVGAPLPVGIVPDPIPNTGGGTPAGGDVDAGTTEAPGTSFGTSAGDFDFMGAFQPPCPNIETDTIIDGECKDSFVDPGSLPDFDAAQLGDSTDVSSCFDLGKCLSNASDVGTGPITLDPSTCSLQLNGANAARLNLALVSTSTGECVRAGECYVPIDHGGSGWQELNGSVQLPPYVCKLITAKKARLASTTDTCAAKQESNPICTPKVGETVTVPEAGPPVAVGPALVFPEDYATSVLSSNGTVFFAAASRVGRFDALAPNAVGTPITGITGTGATHLPWRFTRTQGGGVVALANGTAVGFVINDSSANQVTLGNGAIDVADLEGASNQLAWAVQAPGGTSTIQVSALQGSSSQLDLSVTDVTTVMQGPSPATLLVGSSDGSVRTCIVQPSQQCYPAATVGAGGRVDAFAGRVGTTNEGYVLAASGLYRATLNGVEAPTLASLTPGDLSGLEEGGYHFARGLAVSPKCVFFSSKAGITGVVDGGSAASGFSLVPAPANGTILGLALGPVKGVESIYYAVYAPREQGGGVWTIPVPAQCLGASSGADAGASDAGLDAAPVCGPGNCAKGCCTPAGQCLDFAAAQQSNTQCGGNGVACMDCGGMSCAPSPNGGLCGG